MITKGPNPFAYKSPLRKQDSPRLEVKIAAIKLTSSSADQIQDKFKNEFIKVQTPTEREVLMDETSTFILRGEFDQKFERLNE